MKYPPEVLALLGVHADQLTWELAEHRYLVVREILDRGGLEARAWLHRTLTDNQLRSLVTEFQGAGMSLELRARVRAELGLSEVDLPPHPRVGMPWGLKNGR